MKLIRLTHPLRSTKSDPLNCHLLMFDWRLFYFQNKLKRHDDLCLSCVITTRWCVFAHILSSPEKHFMNPQQKSGNDFLISSRAAELNLTGLDVCLQDLSGPYLCCMCRLNLEHTKFSSGWSWFSKLEGVIRQVIKSSTHTWFYPEAPRWRSAAPLR